MSSAANQKWARFPHRGTIPVHTYANLFAYPIIHCRGEKYFAPTFALGTPLPDRHHSICQSSICSQTSSHLQSSICPGEIFFAPTFAIVTPSLDRYPDRCLSSICSQTFSHTRSSIVGAKYFSPGRRPSVAPNRLVISAPHHLLHGRNIFRPEVGHWWRVTACLFLPRIICGTGEKYFARATIATQFTHEHLARKQLNAIGIIVFNV